MGFQQTCTTQKRKDRAIFLRRNCPKMTAMEFLINGIKWVPNSSRGQLLYLQWQGCKALHGHEKFVVDLVQKYAPYKRPSVNNRLNVSKSCPAAKKLARIPLQVNGMLYKPTTSPCADDVVRRKVHKIAAIIKKRTWNVEKILWVCFTKPHARTYHLALIAAHPCAGRFRDGIPVLLTDEKHFITRNKRCHRKSGQLNLDRKICRRFVSVVIVEAVC